MVPTNIFSRIRSDSAEKIEKRKTSFWLQKLYNQRERFRLESRKANHTENEIVEEKLVERSNISKLQDLKQSGINESTKHIAAKKEEDKQNLNDLVKKSNRCIISISSTFPWELFPDTIDVEETKVTFKFNQLFSSQTHSVEIKDIANVLLETSFFFSTIKVVSRIFIENEIKIEYLDKKKAIKVQSVIEGLRTFAENDINTSNYEIDELITKIDEFNSPVAAAN